MQKARKERLVKLREDKKALDRQIQKELSDAQREFEKTVQELTGDEKAKLVTHINSTPMVNTNVGMMCTIKNPKDATIKWSCLSLNMGYDIVFDKNGVLLSPAFDNFIESLGKEKIQLIKTYCQKADEIYHAYQENLG